MIAVDRKSRTKWSKNTSTIPTSTKNFSSSASKEKFRGTLTHVSARPRNACPFCAGQITSSTSWLAKSAASLSVSTAGRKSTANSPVIRPALTKKKNSLNIKTSRVAPNVTWWSKNQKGAQLWSARTARSSSASTARKSATTRTTASDSWTTLMTQMIVV